MPAAENKPPTFKLTVQTPESIIWQGNAQSLSSINSTGPFDILPDHANMITIVDSQPIEITAGDGTRRFTFEKAVIVVKQNTVMIYANISTTPTTR